MRSKNIMKVFKAVFLILCVFGISAFAQEKAQSPKAYKFFEYEKITDNLLTEKLDGFYKELQKDNSQGYIISYGKDKDAAKREKQIQKSNKFSRPDAPKITFVRGTDKTTTKTVLWIVPKGALPPTPN